MAVTLPRGACPGKPLAHPGLPRPGSGTVVDVADVAGAATDRTVISSAWNAPEFFDKEFFTDVPRGQRKEADLLARVWTRDQTFETLFIHSEQQERERSAPEELPFEDRMFLYSLILQMHKFPDRVVPIAMWFQAGKGPSGPVTYDYRTFGGGCQVTYHRISVPDLRAEEYLAKDNPLAWGLAARMRRGSLSRPQLSLACRSRIVRSQINDVKKVLLLDICETYVKLTKEEEAQVRAMISSQPEYADVKYEDLTYYSRVAVDNKAEGKAEGKAEDLLEVLESREISISDEDRKRITACKDLAQLSRWFKRALKASSIKEILD